MIPEAGQVELAALGAETCGELCAKVEVDIGISLQVYGHDLVVAVGGNGLRYLQRKVCAFSLISSFIKM